MKKIYIAPETEVCDMSLRNYLLVGSTEGKMITGGPTTGTNGNIPTEIGTTGETGEDSYYKGGVRAPEFFGGFDE